MSTNSTTYSKINILYADSEANNLDAFKEMCKDHCIIYAVDSAVEGLKILKKHPIHIVIADQFISGITGVEFLESVLNLYPEPIRILVAPDSNFEVAVNAINKAQVYKYVTKSWDEKNLKEIIDKAYQVYSTRKADKEYIAQLLEINKQLEFMLRQKVIS